MAASLKKLSPHEQKFLGGNGVHLAAMDAWVLYILANTVRIDGKQAISANLSSRTAENADEDEEFGA